MAKVQIAALRVKVKSLAAEARIIRLEEHRAKGRRKCGSGVHPDYKAWLGRDDERRVSLYFHRIRDVRKEARSALLAYAFLRGRDYATCEKPAKHNPPDLKRVRQLVEKFSTNPYWPSPWPAGVLESWSDGTLKVHPFARPAKAVA